MLYRNVLLNAFNYQLLHKQILYLKLPVKILLAKNKINCIMLLTLVQLTVISDHKNILHNNT